MTSSIRFIDYLAVALSLGAIVWFFFVQSPLLIRRIGSYDFVPLQMRMTRVLFRYLSVLSIIVVVAVVAAGNELTGVPMVSSVVAAIATLTNALFVVPRALRAGGHTRSEERTEEENRSVARFASEGGGEASRLGHRLVVVFVLIQAAGLITRATHLVG